MLNKNKFKITIEEEDSLKSLDIVDPQNLFNDYYLAIEENDLIIYNFKTKQKVNTLKFHLSMITSIHLCKRQIFIDNNPLVSSKNIFIVVSSSLDKKIAMHKIIYANNIFKFELIAECEPTEDGINGIIQIENGQFIVSTRDQHIILFSNYIINNNFYKLYELIKPFPMEAVRPFEIKNNIVGIYWQFNDTANDDTMTDNDEWDKNHSNDGLFIYEIKNNEIQEIKNFKKEPSDYHSFIYLKNNLIIKDEIKFQKMISTLDRTNLSFINKLIFTDDNTLRWNFSPINHKFFIVVIWKREKPIKFKIYENKTFKKVFESESDKQYFLSKNNADYWGCSLYKLKKNEYLLKDLIIKIDY